MERKEIINLLKKSKVFPEAIQKKIGRDRAVVYVVYFLTKNSIEATFQRICVVSHKLFPETFSFTEFPEHLDSRNIRNCLWHCRDEKKAWLIGSDKTKYELSEKGKKISLEIEKVNEQGMGIHALPLKLRKKKDLLTKAVDDSYIINEIKSSSAFKKFLEKKDLQKLDIILSLGGDRYSSKNFIEKQLKDALKKAKNRNEKRVVQYLLLVNENWREYFK